MPQFNKYEAKINNLIKAKNINLSAWQPLFQKVYQEYKTITDRKIEQNKKISKTLQGKLNKYTRLLNESKLAICKPHVKQKLLVTFPVPTQIPIK